MANWFVRKTGNDANAGTSAGAAFLTIQKALNAGVGPTGGDTLWVGAGTYRELLTANLTSPVSELKIIADTDGAQTGDSGRVIVSAYLTNDTSAPSANSLVTLNARDFLTFQGFFFQGGGNPVIDGSTAHSTNITFRQCTFHIAATGGNYIRYIGNSNEAAHWLIDRCTCAPNHGGAFVSATSPTFTGADYDVDFVVRNCVLMDCSNFLLIGSSGALANKPGGYIVQNCTLLGGGTGVNVNSTGASTSIPCLVKNTLFYQLNSGVIANTSGQIVENFNLIQASTVRTNVSAGANSIANFNDAALLDLGYSALNGFALRAFAQPLPGSAALGFGNDTTPAALTVDILNRPRPAGGSITNGIGAYELHDTAVKETTTFDVTPSVKIAGPGDHDMLIPVNAAATTITIKVQYDTNHAATNKPQVILQTNGEIGVATQTVTMTAAANTWETLTVGPFTPTAKGYVTLRLVSRSAAANGNAFFDTATVPNINTDGFDYFRYGEPFPALTQNASGGGGLLVNPGMSGGIRG